MAEDVVVRLVLDTSNYTSKANAAAKSTNGITKSADATGKSANKLTGNLGKLGAAVGAAFAAKAVFDFAKSSISAFSNLEDFVTWDEDAGSLVVRPSAEIPRHIKAALESIEDQVMRTTNKDGTRSYERHKQKVKLYPKLEALKLLAEYLGLTESMAPKVTVRLITGIDRTPEPIDVTPEPVTGN